MGVMAEAGQDSDIGTEASHGCGTRNIVHFTAEQIDRCASRLSDTDEIRLAKRVDQWVCCKHEFALQFSYADFGAR